MSHTARGARCRTGELKGQLRLISGGNERTHELKWDQVSGSLFLGTPKSASLGPRFGVPKSTEAGAQALGRVDPAEPEASRPLPRRSPAGA